jgi:hypothetical protein
MIHTPVHASWLNQIEIVFSIIQKKVLTPNDFPGGTLSHALHAFVNRYNRTARPFNWKFNADDLTALLRRISQREQAATSQQATPAPGHLIPQTNLRCYPLSAQFRLPGAGNIQVSEMRSSRTPDREPSRDETVRPKPRSCHALPTWTSCSATAATTSTWPTTTTSATSSAIAPMQPCADCGHGQTARTGTARTGRTGRTGSALPNLAVLDQGGASRRRWPGVSVGLWPWETPAAARRATLAEARINAAHPAS